VGETSDVAESSSAEAAGTSRSREGVCILWADLHTGFIGFPSGLDVPAGPAGSVMKLVAAAAILEHSLLDPNHKFDCLGHTHINNEEFHCQHAHGHVDLPTAIAVSCNCYFIHAAHHLSSAQMIEFARKFGLAAPIAHRASGEFPASVPSKSSKSSEPAEPSYTFILGLSRALQPTALQLLRVAALIGSDGQAPYLHSADDMEAGEPFRLQLKDSTWRTLRQGMELAVRHGTARNLDPENQMHVAAKTGTVTHGKKFQSCVIGYFPSQAPKNAFCVWAPSGTSQESAVPEAKQFLFSTTWP